MLFFSPYNFVPLEPKNNIIYFIKFPVYSSLMSDETGSKEMVSAGHHRVTELR